MRSDIPSSIQETIHDLEADAIVELFHIVLPDTTEFFLTKYDEVTWQGDLYETLPCSMSDMGRDADGKMTRPKFSFANPAGIFTASVASGQMDHAQISRIRLLKADLVADNNFSMRDTFRVSRVVNLSRTMSSVELRDALDGALFQLPPRVYRPPEFPHVKL